MQIPPADLPDLTDASAKTATGKTIKHWFQHLDNHVRHLEDEAGELRS